MLVAVRVEDHATVLRLLARRHSQIAWARNKAVCRLHALVSELVPGGITEEVVVPASVSGSLSSSNRWVRSAGNDTRLALELLDDIARYDDPTQSVRARGSERRCVASGTTLTEVFGIGDAVVAAR